MPRPLQIPTGARATLGLIRHLSPSSWGNRRSMDLTPFLSTAEQGSPEEDLESLLIPGRVAVAAKGRFLLRSLCRSFGGEPRITGAVTDQESCLVLPGGASQRSLHVAGLHRLSGTGQWL